LFFSNGIERESASLSQHNDYDQTDWGKSHQSLDELLALYRSTGSANVRAARRKDIETRFQEDLRRRATLKLLALSPASSARTQISLAKKSFSQFLP
jgi:hypothetical protein